VSASPIVSPSDETLLSAVASGDRHALRVLYERHAPWLTLRLERRCADADVVDDAVQDTFVVVWRSAACYHADGAVAAWIWGIAIRRLIDALRRRPRREFVSNERVELECSAEEQVLLGVEHGDLAGALDRLSPELRAVVQATILDGLTTREASRLLRIPAGTVKTRAMRARIQLRGELA
jgi:RNA polymerase sigma-70 factor (ECF subfamily)